MQFTTTTQVRRRAALLWLAVTSAVAALFALAAPSAHSLAAGPAVTYDALLVQCCAVAALGAGLGLWLTTTNVLRQVLGSDSIDTHGVGPVRAGLLGLCGVALVAAAGPALAQEAPDVPLAAEVLAGLPLPDRADDRAQVADRAEDRAQVTVRVRDGESLWSIAAQQVGPDATITETATYWRALHSRNAAVIGPDPDLIHPGLLLHLPPR